MNSLKCMRQYLNEDFDENLFDNRHDVRKNELYDSIENFVFFRSDVRDDFDDCLIDLVLEDLEKIDALRIRWFFCFFDVFEIDCDKWEKEEIYQTLSFCVFDENHDVVWATKKRSDKFEKRWAILCSFDELSRFLSVFDRFRHEISMSDSKNLSNDSLFDDFRFSSDMKCLLCVNFLNDELILKRSSSLICSSSCQIACFVEIENDASRCLEFWNKCAYDVCYCRTNEFNINVDLSCVEELRHRLIKEQIIENALEFFDVQTISVESFEECRLINWDIQDRFDEKVIRIVIQIWTSLANQNAIIEIFNRQTHVDDWFWSLKVKIRRHFSWKIEL
jgi:hypothetical protein